MKRFLTIALIVSLSILVYFFIQNNRKHSAEAIIQINPHGRLTHTDGEKIMTNREYFQTQLALIKSDETINQAIKNYKLAELYDTDEANLLKIIKTNLELTRQPESELITIKVFSDNEQKAQQICFAIVVSYDQHRREKFQDIRNQFIENYKQKIKAQEIVVEQMKKRLINLSESLGISFDTLTDKVAEPVFFDKEHTSYGRVNNQYERELKILNSLKSSPLIEMFAIGHGLDQISYLKYPATPEIDDMMQARKR